MPNWRDAGRFGTTTNDNAASGEVGEYATSQLAVGAATALVTATPKTITSMALPAGDYDVWGVVNFLPAGTTSLTGLAEGISLVANTFGADDTYVADSSAAFVPGAIAQRKNVPSQRILLPAPTTVYLIGYATFTVAGMTAYGSLFARRRR